MSKRDLNASLSIRKPTFPKQFRARIPSAYKGAFRCSRPGTLWLAESKEPLSMLDSGQGSQNSLRVNTLTNVEGMKKPGGGITGLKTSIKGVINVSRLLQNRDSRLSQ
ncbi:hypothetical protein SAMN05216308_106172 [Nitrosospira sp. Nsp13]|nr:hypothetical protein SAMN05216308_106172 [Nitrosospira sp. Nsp13]